MAVKGPRIVFFDIESTDLRPPFGGLLCCSFVDQYSNQVTTFRLDEKPWRDEYPEQDHLLATGIKDVLESSWIWVGWNSIMFDVPFINARLLLAKLPPLEQRMHIDLMYSARLPKVKWMSSKLDSVAKMLKLQEQKTDLDYDMWIKARRLETKAMNYVVKHNQQDVLVLKEAFNDLAPMVRSITRH